MPVSVKSEQRSKEEKESKNRRKKKGGGRGMNSPDDREDGRGVAGVTRERCGRCRKEE